MIDKKTELIRFTLFTFSTTNKVCETADEVGSHECDTNKTSCNLTNQELASQSLAAGNQIELENNDNKQAINNRNSPCLISKSPAETIFEKVHTI